jgi:anti-sigma factor RsiW
MNQCTETRAQVAFYLDGELQGSERKAFETHLNHCASCQSLFDAERSFLASIRAAQPIHRAAPELRARVEQVLSDAPAIHSATPQLRKRVRRSLLRLRFGKSNVTRTPRIAAVALILVAGLAATLWVVTEYLGRRPNPPSEFALLAVDTHQRYIRGQLPLEITSGLPEQISTWFVDKVPFSVELPNFQESSGQEKLYALDGARLVGYNNEYAAYVAYKMQRRPISLLVTSGGVAQAAGGEEIVSKGLTFHYDSIGGLKVITWSHRGLTYALVSDLEERGQQSCVVCHQGSKDQDFMDGLKKAIP